jgi:hypothetical protein
MKPYLAHVFLAKMPACLKTLLTHIIPVFFMLFIVAYSHIIASQAYYRLIRLIYIGGFPGIAYFCPSNKKSNMKKLYFAIACLLALAASQPSLAQTSTTITSTALPQIGYTYNMVADTMPAEVATFMVSAGSSSYQTWTYTTGFTTTFSNPTAFTPPSSGTNSSSFPTANVAADQQGTWAYFLINSTGMNMVGAQTTVSGSAATVNFTPAEILIPTPYTYTSSPIQNNYTSTFTIVVSSITATVHHRARRTITPDAFGSLTTPAGTYANTLRVKSYEITSDSVYVFGSFNQAQYDTTTTYDWLQNSADLQLLEIAMDKGKMKKVKYMQSLSTGIDTPSQLTSATTLSPNPASDVVYVQYENKSATPVKIELFDITGKYISTLLQVDELEGKHVVPVNLYALPVPKGLYFIRLSHEGTSETLKLTIL